MARTKPDSRLMHLPHVLQEHYKKRGLWDKIVRCRSGSGDATDWISVSFGVGDNETWRYQLRGGWQRK